MAKKAASGSTSVNHNGREPEYTSVTTSESHGKQEFGQVFNYHSVTFTYTNSKGVETSVSTTTWGLIPSSRPDIVMPTPNYNYVDVPGRSDGPIDLSDYLTGKTEYTQRKGTMEFIALNDHGNWAARKKDIANVLNGQKIKIRLSDDDQYYYKGRAILKDWKTGPKYSTVTIEYTLNPHRYRSRVITDTSGVHQLEEEAGL